VGRIPEETIEALRERIDIVDLVGRYISLRQSGRSFKGLCPFHDEKTPSFHVNPERDVFHCFGCGVGGDAFQFVMRHDNLSFPESVRVLAREVGIEIPESEGSDGGVTQTLCDMNERACRLFQRTLLGSKGEAARAYLETRGLDVPAIERFGVGFAPDAWDTLCRALRAAKLDVELGVRAGLLTPRRGGDGHFDFFRGRVIFPIHDVRGRVVAFGGRALSSDQEPKYLNTPETPVFRKRESFYGFPEALAAIRKAEQVVVVEGYFDRIALAMAGVPEAVATCGTALTREHARQLRRRTRKVVLLFDADAAGERALERALEVLLPEGLRVRAGILPAGEDPADVLEREGPEALRKVVGDAPPAFSYLIRRAAMRGRGTPWEKADAVSAVVRQLAAVSDPVERGEFARQLALAVDARIEDVDDALRGELRQRGAPDAEPIVARPRREGPEARNARQLARLVIEMPVLAARIDAGEIASLCPEVPWNTLLSALCAAAQRSGAQRLDLHALSEELEIDARTELAALAVESEYFEAETAERAVEDLLVWFRRRRRFEAARGTTQRFRAEPSTDPREIFETKQMQIEERRRAQGLPPGSAGTGERP
jgi:DNA primase